MAAFMGNLVSKSVHVGCLPRFHDWMSFDCEMSFADFSLGSVVELAIRQGNVATLLGFVPSKVDLIMPFALFYFEIGEHVNWFIFTLNVPSRTVERPTELEHLAEVNW